MNEAPSPIPPLPARKRSWRRRLLVAGVMLLIVGLGVFAVVSRWQAQELREALAETDRSDPHWRMPDLEAHRVVLRDEDNAAFQIRKARKALPLDWPFNKDRLESIFSFDPEALILVSAFSGLGSPGGQPWNALGSVAAGEATTHAVWNQLFDPPDLPDGFVIEPPVLLNQKQERWLRAELPRVAEAIQEARRLVDFPRGRIPIPWEEDYSISTRLPWIQDARSIPYPLQYDLFLRCQDGDLAGALVSCHAMHNASKSLGDDPCLTSQMIRMVCRTMMLRSLERILAQGEPPEELLGRMQRLLEEDEQEPLVLFGIRGERAGCDGYLEAVQQGRIKLGSLVADVGGSGPSGGSRSWLDNLKTQIQVGSVSHNRAVLLRRMNRMVQIAQMPPEQQDAELDLLDGLIKNDPWLVKELFRPIWIEKVIAADRRSVALIRCLIVALAAERYRQANHHWPDQLTELCPRYLTKEVPRDPFDGQPLRYRPTAEGVVLYSVSEDRMDNGGNLSDNTSIKGTDLGVRLWNAARRRQRPRSGS